MGTCTFRFSLVNEELTVNWIDLVLLVFFAFAMQMGFQKGFVKQIATIGSIAVGIILAGQYHVQLANSEYFQFVVNELGDKTALVLSYLGIFAGTIITGQLSAFIIRRSLKGRILEQVDNLFGGAFAIAKVYVVIGILVVGIFQFLPKNHIRQQLSESYLAPKIAGNFQSLIQNIPEEYRKKIDSFMARQKPVQADFRRLRLAKKS